MKSLTESPAVLTVHQGQPGQYVIRISSLEYRPLIVGVTKLLEDAESFVVITPNDTKVFSVGSAIKEVENDDPEPMPPAEEEFLTPVDPEVVGDTPQGTKVVRRKKNAYTAGHEQTCGRCKGVGKIQIMLDGGAGAETTCPICKGSGTARRYGVRP